MAILGPFPDGGYEQEHGIPSSRVRDTADIWFNKNYPQ